MPVVGGAADSLANTYAIASHWRDQAYTNFRPAIVPLPMR